MSTKFDFIHNIFTVTVYIKIGMCARRQSLLAAFGTYRIRSETSPYLADDCLCFITLEIIIFIPSKCEYVTPIR